MSLLAVQSLSFRHGSAPLLEGIDFHVASGDRVGLVGTNGCGKSTLMAILSGTLEPEDGEVIYARGCRVRLVEQFLPESLRDTKALDVVAEEAPELHVAEELLTRLGFDHALLDREASKLSGGWINRLLLARAVASDPDVLLLDEPTNHMDVQTVVRFQDFLARRVRAAVVLISHDRELLDAVTTRTVFLRGGESRAFDLPYSRARCELLDQERAALVRREAEQKNIDRLEKSMKRLAHWGHVYDNEDLSRRARNIGRRIEKLETSQTVAPWADRRTLGLAGAETRASRALALEEHTVTIPGGQDLYHVPWLHVPRGERLCLLGPNGAGKTLLMKDILEAATGEGAISVKVSPQAVVGYYDQALEHGFSPEATLFETVREASSLQASRLRSALVNAGFPAGEHARQVSSLSGGERARLRFLVLKLRRPTLLLLDEPTNHVDVEGCESLEAELLESDATVVFVSHDRRFVRTVATRYLLIKDGELLTVDGPDVWYDQPSTDAPSSVAEPEPVADIEDRILELEALLEADLSRKAKHQKPALQEQWRSELEVLYAQLG
jgi:ATP-binding cassette, subfamily F, member 3